jgi:hypothetical protein
LRLTECSVKDVRLLPMLSSCSEEGWCS